MDQHDMTLKKDLTQEKAVNKWLVVTGNSHGELVKAHSLQVLPSGVLLFLGSGAAGETDQIIHAFNASNWQSFKLLTNRA